MSRGWGIVGHGQRESKDPTCECRVVTGHKSRAGSAEEGRQALGPISSKAVTATRHVRESATSQAGGHRMHALLGPPVNLQPVYDDLDGLGEAR